MNEDLPKKQVKIFPLYLKIILLVMVVVLLFEGFLLLKFQKGNLSFTLKENKYGLKLDQKVAIELADQLTFGQKNNNKFFVWDTKTWHEDVGSVEIEFVDSPLAYGVVVDSFDSGKVLGSFNNEYKNKKLFLKIQVADSAVSQDLSDLEDIYTGAIMRAFFFSKSPDFIQDNTSQDKLNTAVLNQIESGRPLLSRSNTSPIDNLINQIIGFISFLKPGSFTVKAAGCYGTYECGTQRSTTVARCTRDGGIIPGICNLTRCGLSCGVGGTCVCTTSYWCDGTSSDAQPCGGDASTCTGSRCGTSGSCTYSNSCTWDSSTPPPVSTPTPAPTTPPPVSYQCTVQGYKVVMPGNQVIQPASGQTVTLNDPATSTTAEPYFLYYQSAGKSRTVSVSVPAGYTVGYTLCYNNTGCHTSAPVMSNTVTLPDNSFCGSSAGFADLWWHYYPPAVPNCKNLTGPSSLYVGETGTFTATYENGTATIDQRGLAIYREGQCEPNTAAFWNKVPGAAGTQSFNWVPSSASMNPSPRQRGEAR